MKAWRMILALSVLSFGSIIWLGSAHSAEAICTVKTVCVRPHKPTVIKPIVLDKFLYLCLYSEPLIIVLPSESIPLSLNVPTSNYELPADPTTLSTPAESPVVAASTPSDDSSGTSGGAYGEYGYGGGSSFIPFTPTVNPPMRAPEMSVDGTTSGVLFLAGSLAVLLSGKRRK